MITHELLPTSIPHAIEAAIRKWIPEALPFIFIRQIEVHQGPREKQGYSERFHSTYMFSVEYYIGQQESIGADYHRLYEDMATMGLKLMRLFQQGLEIWDSLVIVTDLESHIGEDGLLSVTFNVPVHENSIPPAYLPVESADIGVALDGRGIPGHE